MPSYLYHLCPREAWDHANHNPSTPYFPPTYTADGFIHLTKDPSLLLTVANHFYKSDPTHRVWIVLVIDQHKLTSPVKFEPAAPVGNTSSEGLHTTSTATTSTSLLFPHLYGPIDTEAVVDEVEVERDSKDGTFLRIPQHIT